MLHLQNLTDVELQQASRVTIGVFDGVHRGHQALIRALVDEAHQANEQAVVLTFYPHPDVVLRGIEKRYYLTSPNERAQLLGDLGVDVVITHPFDERVRSIRAADFVGQMCQYLKMTTLWVGSDFALGYQREGTVDYLSELGKELDFSVSAVDLVAQEGGVTITSTLIRQALYDGHVDDVKRLLGRAYEVEGEVIQGNQRGRTIGFPTANMAIWEKQVLPSYGVYAGWVWVDGQRYGAVTNIGVRPTFDGQDMTVEPYILDFNRDIYGETIRLSFEHRLRSEQKFDGIDALKSQLQADIAQGRILLGL